MEISKLQLSNLRNDEHITLMEFTAAATAKYQYITEMFPKPVEFFTDAYEKENEAYLKSTRSLITKQVQAANEARILRFRSLNALLYSASTCAEPAKAEAGEFLLEIVKDYGGESKIIRKRVNALTGVLTNLVEDFQGRFAEKTEVAGATECTEELRVANETYKTLRSDRTEEASEQEKSALRDARTACDTEWRDLVDSVNLRYHYEKDAQLLPFMRYMNAEIDTYRIGLGQGVGGSGSSSGTDGDGTASTKTATFVFIGGRKESFPVEVGTVLIAPSNTEGYRWKPEVPEVMPATNKTFREVPIEEAEATATFHFFDHTEEEITQKVGTALEAPQNTEGYYWDPTVPATMPDEDTSYYELPEAERKYTVTWFGVDGTPIVSYDLPAGNMVPDAPTPPEGYKWPHTPMVMPSRNLEIRPEPIEG